VRERAGTCTWAISLGDWRRDRQHGTVASHDPTIEQHHFARGMRGDRFWNAAGRVREKGSGAADRDTVIRDAKCTGTGAADQSKGRLDLVVATEGANS
jgi:hypothetical protein